MNRAIFALIFVVNIGFSEDFITDFEYGQMLYDNPRGVSCSKCHGKLGEGKFIASFVDDNGVEHKFYGSNISRVSLDEFKKALERGNNIMPRYYLTNKEIESIFKYIKKVNHISLESNGSSDKNSTKSDSDEIKVDADIIEEFEDKPKENESGGIISKIFNSIDDLEDADARVSDSGQESK